jgi:hypothetical protein
MPTHEPEHGDGGDTTNPWIVIPYFSGDDGIPGTQRPLTVNTPIPTYWLCPAIKVQGVNYTAVPGSYIPDQPLAITVDVENRGVPTAQVTVNIAWAAPSTGFFTPHWILSSTFPVPGRSVAGSTTSPQMIWTPEQAKIPQHFCLLANAICFPPEPDPGPTTPDPVNDRHWAQYNLQAAVLPASKNYSSVFWAVNPQIESAVFSVTVRPVSEEALKMIARMVKAEPVAIKDEQLTLHRATEEAKRRELRQARVVLELGRGDRQPLVVSAHSVELASQQFTAIEVVQTRLGTERGEGVITGSLGIVLFTAQAGCGEARSALAM